jgi:uncharacterized surface protein with fasciclin (FAS1) repeats
VEHPFIKAFFICQAFDKPLNDMTATEVLAEEGRFRNFIRALELSGVGDKLEKKGPYTIFAPVDDVFNLQAIGDMLSSMKIEQMVYHFIVPGKYIFSDIHRLQVLQTVSGYPLVITARDGIEVSGAEIIKPDVPYDKGVIHEISAPDAWPGEMVPRP